MRHISLFSGAGGLDLGFEAAGFEPTALVEVDPVACATLTHNRPHWPVQCMDVADFDATEHAGVDAVIGGPPCQGFSTAGKWDPQNPANRLWRQYLRVVEQSMPRALVLENVPAMASPRSREHWEQLIESLSELGYRLAHGVLNASHYGTAQARRRLILIGALDTCPTLPEPTTEHAPVAVGPVLADLADHPDDPAMNHVPRRHAPAVVARWQKLGPGELDRSYKRNRLDPAAPSFTIRAGGQMGASGSHLAGFHPPIHPHLPRQLTVRESARIQGFADDWFFCGRPSQQGRQVGNAVPVPLATALGWQVHHLLQSPAG